MTKKHYEAIARIILQCELEDTTIVHMLATYFESDNPRFDRVRFLKACGVESEPREGVCECGYPCVYGTDHCERHQTP